MIARSIYIERLASFINTPQVKVITGIRRSGKSTILRWLKEVLLERGVKEEQIVLVNFESFAFLNLPRHPNCILM